MITKQHSNTTKSYPKALVLNGFKNFMFLEICEFLTAQGLQARFKKNIKKGKCETQRRCTERRIPREIRAAPQPQQHSENNRCPPETPKGARPRSDRNKAVLYKALHTKGVTLEGRSRRRSKGGRLRDTRRRPRRGPRRSRREGRCREDDAHW